MSPLNLSLRRSRDVITAAFQLHNFCIDYGELMEMDNIEVLYDRPRHRRKGERPLGYIPSDITTNKRIGQTMMRDYIMEKIEELPVTMPDFYKY